MLCITTLFPPVSEVVASKAYHHLCVGELCDTREAGPAVSHQNGVFL